MIHPSEISRLAHRSRLGDKTIEKDYVLTWVLFAIANAPLRDRVAFKGGTAIKKIYEPEYRFSEDLDFTLLDEISNHELTAEIEALFPWLQHEVNITLAMRKIEVHQSGSPAFYLDYVGPLRGDLSSRFLKVDFTCDEIVLFPLVQAQIQTPYSDCQQRVETLHCYALEEILAEKMSALLGRSEPRDLFDIYYLLTQHLVDFENVSIHLKAKMEHRGLNPTDLITVLERKSGVLSRLWEPRLQGQMADLPHIDAVIRETNRWLRQLRFA